MSRSFLPQSAFGALSSYQLLPFRFHRLDEQTEILVNESGEYLLVPKGTARNIVRKEIPINSELYPTLKAKHFIYDESSSPLLDVLAAKYRTKFGFIYGSTKFVGVVHVHRVSEETSASRISENALQGCRERAKL